MTKTLTINRRGWLAMWAQNRRRSRCLLPGPVLKAQYPDLAVWDWPYPDPYRWNAYDSLDGGVTWRFDDFEYGDARQYAPDGGGEPMFIVGVDANGKEITERSNVIRPDYDETLPGFTNGLVAHFGFEEESGNRLDDLYAYALAPLNQDMGNAEGIIDFSVYFDGSGGYLSGTGDTTIFSPTSDGFAVSVWVNFEYTGDPSETAYIASVWNDTQWPTGSAWHIFAAPDCGWVSAEVLGQISGFNGLSGPGDLSGWAHICLVFYPLANQWSLYVNGALVATVNCDYRPVAGRLGVGLHTNPITPPPDCRVDELAIWSRDLSASEVAQLYNNGNGLPFELF